MKKLYKISLITLLVTNLSAEYRLVVGKRATSSIDRLRFNTLADMRNIPQNLNYYAKQVEPISYSKMMAYDREYNRAYFKPWSITYLTEPKNELMWQIKFVKRRKIYDGTRRVISKKRWKYWIRNSNFKALNSVRLKAITLKHSNIRAFPTNTAAYLDPKNPTKWFPFDYFQHSAIYPNTPIFVSHFSLDKRWAFVQVPYTSGWIKVSDIGFVSSKFVDRFKSGHYSVAIKDDLWLLNGSKRVSLVKLGTIFPVINGKKYVAVRGKGYSAKIEPLKIVKGILAKKPLKMSARNVAMVAREFYNEPYGWGGKMQTRDCSATTRDFFTPFGIFLKRNSSKQAKSGSSIYIKGLAKKQKKATIIANAKPFRSMLFVPGHITLYLGRYKNEPVIMHTYWGVRLKNWSKYPLSRTIITTTELGKELPNIREKSKLINTLKYIINF